MQFSRKLKKQAMYVDINYACTDSTEVVVATVIGQLHKLQVQQKAVIEHNRIYACMYVDHALDELNKNDWIR